MNINTTRASVAEFISIEIDNWLNYRSQNRTIYVTDEGNIDSYTVNRPRDHYADMLIISEWAFGDRDESDADGDLTTEEQQGLIELFSSEWAIETVMNSETGADEELYYEEDRLVLL